jgi:hypothetical protein
VSDAVNSLPESALPSEEHRLLLRAALLDDAAAAWCEWNRRVALDDMDEASMRLMPLVSANLRRLGVEHGHVRRLRGIHRYWWSRNQMLMRRLAIVLDGFNRESIPVMVLKGVPLALS